MAKFNILHQKHLSALRGGRIVLAHEILSEIHKLSFELSREEFWGRHHAWSDAYPDTIINYKIGDIFENGPLIQNYVQSPLITVAAPRKDIPTDEEIIREYLGFSALSLIDDREEQPPNVLMLAASLRDPDPYVRHRAGAALTSMGRVVLPTLIAALDDPAHDIRHNAAGALGQIGLDAIEAVSALMAALSPARSRNPPKRRRGSGKDWGRRGSG